MRPSRLKVRIPLRIRAHTAALVPAVSALAAIAISPVGAELARAEGPSASRSASVVFGGMTSNGWPVIAEVASDGRRIKRLAGAVSATCSLGGSWVFPSTWRDMPVGRTGIFKASFHDTDVIDGIETRTSESVAGKLNRARTKIAVTWSLSTTFRQADGTEDVCDTGLLKATLRH